MLSQKWVHWPVPKIIESMPKKSSLIKRMQWYMSGTKTRHKPLHPLHSCQASFFIFWKQCRSHCGNGFILIRYCYLSFFWPPHLLAIAYLHNCHIKQIFFTIVISNKFSCPIYLNKEIVSRVLGIRLTVDWFRICIVKILDELLSVCCLCEVGLLRPVPDLKHYFFPP